ncbi:MAG: type IV secretion system DNA-binding domain-containing protein [Patescibacteria group bacterium]
MPLFALQVEMIGGNPLEAVASDLSVNSFLNDPLVLIIGTLLGVFALAGLILYAIHYIYAKRGRAKVAFDLKVMLVKVPKETKKEDMEQTKSTQQIQETISVMETVFATVGSLKSERGIIPWLFGRNSVFSFEIVMHRDKISFYIAVPSKYRQFTEQQIHAQFPNAEVTDEPDYNIFTPNGLVMGCYLKQRRSSAFPVKTYRKLESDPLNSLTNALSKVEEGDGVAVQFVVSSAPPKWRREGLHIARAMQQGKKLSEVHSGGKILSAVGSELGRFAQASQSAPSKPAEAYRLSPLEEEMVKGLEEKASKAGLDVNIRVVVSSANREKAKRYLTDILGSFGQYNVYEYGNSFVKATPRFQSGLIRHFIYRHYDPRFRVTLNAEEMASLYHFPLATTETPKINWLLVRRALPPPNLPSEGISLGVSDYRGHEYKIRMKPEDRRRHMYIIGGSGTGKSQLQASLIRQDILAGRGVCVIDPHGELAEQCLGYVPKERADDVIYFNPADVARPMGLNMLEYDPKYPEQKTFVINEMLKIFDKLYDLKSTGGPMFEQYMRNAMILIMDDPASGSTLMEIPKVLSDEEFRAFKLTKCTTQVVKDFWTKEAQKAGGEASLANMVPYITSKLTPFIANDIMRPIIGQQNSAFNVRQAMDEGKILLLNLSKGKLGDLNAYLIGMVLVGKILMAALSRTDMDPQSRKDFYLYIDEFQNFLTDSISAILSEARKYGLDLIVAHQYIGQLVVNNDTRIRDAIFGNVGTKCVFRVGVDDAEFLSKEYAPVFGQFDMVNVPGMHCLMRLLIDNTASRPFMNKVIPAPWPDAKSKELAAMITELSRYKYGRKRELVEAEILERQREQEAKAGETTSGDDDFFKL